MRTLLAEWRKQEEQKQAVKICTIFAVKKSNKWRVPGVYLELLQHLALHRGTWPLRGKLPQASPGQAPSGSPLQADSVCYP